MPFCSDRQFRLWDYNVSHNQMLLRSPRSSDVSTNIDIVFWGVDYLDIPTAFDGVVFAAVSREELGRVERILRKECDPSTVYCLLSADKRFFIVASGFKVLRNDLDIFDSSLEYFAATDAARHLGEVLAHS